MARVQAVKTLEQMSDVAEQKHGSGGQAATPGVTIIIMQPTAEPKILNPAIITVEPTPMMLTTGR
jgi:hypothetical protein